MICVVSGEYSTQPVRTGISDAPRCLPARLISTPTCPASMRVTRTSSENKMINPSNAATPITIARNPGMFGLMTNGGRSPPSRGPLLNTPIIYPQFVGCSRYALEELFPEQRYEYHHTKLV